MRLVIAGAGAFGKTVQDIAEQSGRYSQIVFLDDAPKADDNTVVGKISDFRKQIDADTEFLVAIGNNECRHKTITAIVEAGGVVARLIHPSAYVSPTATIGTGSIILPNACVGTGVTMAEGCIINLGAIVDHNVQLGASVHVAPGAIIKGNNCIEAYTKVESREVIQRGQFPLG